MNSEHNHVTAVVKDPGECPACDQTIFNMDRIAELEQRMGRLEPQRCTCKATQRLIDENAKLRKLVELLHEVYFEQDTQVIHALERELGID